jgi:hypothetical protein
MDTTKLLLFGGAAGAVWWFFLRDPLPSDAMYQGDIQPGATCPGTTTVATVAMHVYYSPSTKQAYCSTTAPTAAQIAAGKAANVPSGGSVQAAPSSPSSGTPAVSNSIDGIYAKLISAAGGTGNLGVDAWGFYLNQALSQSGLGPAPDPAPIFSLGADRSQTFSAADYWAKMAPALKSAYGLSGLGRRGLGCMYDVMVRG